VLREHDPDVMQRLGTRLLFAGTALFVLALITTSLTTFVIGAVIAGAGFGPAFLGAFRTVSQLAEPHRRAGLISAIYVVSYLAFSIPALVAGVVISHEGLRGTSLVYGAVVAGVAAVTSLYDTVESRRAA
jgi:MFS family permease